MTRRDLIGFALFAALIGLVRLHTYDEPLERDITTYAVVGHELLAGRSLYADVWDHKPPAIHATFALAELAAGYGPSAVYLLGTSAALVTLFGVMWAAAWVAPRAALWGGASWVIVSSDMMLQANQPNTEVFINAALVVGFAVLLRSDGRGGVLRDVIVGAAFALATLYKPVAFASAAVLLAVDVAASPPGARQRRAVHRSVVVLVVVAVAWLALFGYFAAVGTFGSFWDAVFVYNRDYQARGWDVATMRRALFPPEAGFLLPLVAAMVLGGALSLRRSVARPWVLLAAYLIGTLVAIVLPGHRHVHYSQLWLPPLCIGTAWGIEALMRAQLRVGRLVGFAVLGLCLAHELPPLTLSADQWSEKKYSGTSHYGRIFVTARDLAPKLDALLEADESFYEFGDETGLYMITRRRPPSGVFYAYPLLEGPLVEPLSARLLADLKRTKPELFVLSGGYVTQAGDGTLQIPSQAALLELLADYRPAWIAKGRPNFYLFVREGGRLQARIERSPQAPEYLIFSQ